MKTSKLLLLSISALIFGSVARAQLVPVADITLAYPSISAVTIELGNNDRTGLPTPFIINPNSTPVDSLVWFCLDPLQTIYIKTSGLPPGSFIDFDSTNPANFNEWNSNARGLSNDSKHKLADLFTAYPPVLNNQLVAGALQMAVWEIVNEFDTNSLNLSNGQLEVHGGNEDATTIALAQSMLNSLGTAAVLGKGNISYLSYLIDGTYTNNNCEIVLVQDLLGWHPPGFTPPIPESDSYALGAAAVLLPLALWRIRRRKLTASVQA